MWTRVEKEDTALLIEYLRKHSPNTCNLLSNVKYVGVGYNPFQFRSGYYYMYMSENGIEGLIANYNDGNTFVHLENDDIKDGAQNIICQLKFHSVWGLSNWLPEVKILEYHVNYKLDARNLITLIRDKETPLPETPHKLVRVDNKIALNRYMPFIRKCLYEGFGFKTLSIDIKKRMRERRSNEPYYILYDKNTPVSQAHIQSVTDEYGYIAGICTPRAYRRKGYAKEITSYACKFVESMGLTSALTVNETNTAAMKLYYSMGFYDKDYTVVYMKHRDFCGDENE